MSTFLLMARVTALCLLAYYGTANCLIKAVETVTFYQPFSRKMADNGVYSLDDHRHLLMGRWLPMGVLFFVSTALSVYLALRAAPIGPVVGVIALLTGLAVFRRMTRDPTCAMQRFVVQYRDFMDPEHFQTVLKSDYGMTLEELSGYKRS